MRVENARRVTGPSILPLTPPCVAIEWLYESELHAADPAWEDLSALLVAIGPTLGIGDPALVSRTYSDGSGRTMALGVTSPSGCPLDKLLPLIDWLEWLSFELEAGRPFTPDPARQELALQKWQEFSSLSAPNPSLVALDAWAREHRVPFLFDDDHASLGWGPRSQTWPLSALPSNIELLDPQAFGRIPVVLVTGTNGKTTTTRMVTRILRHAGLHVGASSTDGITIDDRIIDSGDWSGPGAARQILRRTDIDAAVLETARGGILRRGLGISAADGVDAAIVTNIGADHFGEYGINSLEEMADVKSVVWNIVKSDGACVVNADDPLLAARVRSDLSRRASPRPWVAFSVTSDNPLVTELRALGHRVFFVENGHLVTALSDTLTRIVAISDIPATFGGRAPHNIANALGAAALAMAVGCTPSQVASGLSSFGKTPDDNPGRLEVHRVGGLRLVLDFGHNPHGIRALAPAIHAMLAATPGARLFVSVGAAGDRSDADLGALVSEIATLHPSRAFLRPLRGYERGRELMAIPEILRQAFLDCGLAEDALEYADSEVGAIERALQLAHPDDLILILVHVERDEVRAWLDAGFTQPQ